MTRGWRIALGVLAGIVGLNVALAALRAVTGGSPGGPTSSSYATAGEGAAAFASLLERAGHDVVRERVTPQHVALDPRDTVVVLDAPDVLPADADALRQFLVLGGRLLAAPDGAAWLRRVVATPPVWSSRSVRRAVAIAPVAELRDVRRIELAGDGAWVSAGGAIAALGNAEASVLAVAPVGSGRALLLADSSPFQNGYLDRADNARLATALAGAPSRRVLFFESYHGYGRGTGLGAIPPQWRVAILLACLAGLVFMLARIRRLGPPELASRPFAPARREYIDALAATLARTRDRGAALAPVRREIRDRITRRAGQRPDAPDADVGAAAARFGLAKDEVDAFLRSEPPFDELAIGRALARTATERRQL